MWQKQCRHPELPWPHVLVRVAAGRCHVLTQARQHYHPPSMTLLHSRHHVPGPRDKRGGATAQQERGAEVKLSWPQLLGRVAAGWHCKTGARR